MNPAISDYALIGNCETAALVSRTGSMDWFCSPRFDSPACFAALLGSAENGRWLIAPHAKAKVSRRYRPHTLILETEFETSSGRAVLIDFMPMNEINPRVIRIVHGIRGRVSMQMDLVIRFDYGLSVPWVKQEHGALVAVSGPNRLVLHSSVPVEGKGLHSVSKFTVSAGKSVTFELQHGSSFHPQPRGKAPHASLEKTQRFWHHWNSRCNYKGPFAQDVERSLMTLKALIYDPTGGMVAAPTTSVPEKPGGDWNWDYRYCWVRDATFTLLAFIHAGYHEEARRWNKWLMRSAAGSADQMQVMYGITGERLLNEWQVPWLTGYNGAKPVRVGNAASEQLQLDVFGELADALHQARTSIQENGGDFDLQVALLRRLKQIWREPDNGIWEIRGKKQHYTHSKVMAWVAFDRTIRSAERLNVNCPLDEWRAVRQAIHEDVCRRGYNPRLQSFVRTYGSQDFDASLLLLPIVGFLPANDARVEGTVRMIEKHLLRKGFVMRYALTRHGRQINMHEGTFLPCTFWLADYYELAGRHDDAVQILQRLLKVQNDVGLLSEEYLPGKKRLVGNFPQAWSHVALINTVINLHREKSPVRQRSTRNHHATT